MKAVELKALRLEAGMTQDGAAKAMGITGSAYAAYERGTKPIPEDAAYLAERRLGARGDRCRDEETVLALGEAVLLLGAEAREELLANVRRETVLKAVAEVTLARCRGSVVEAIGERDARIRQLEGR
ncbi:helix-turn-helix domain-containing protein [Enorma phocaeensis]|uniref:helix-turn-helix domain-containing protein n=1 Tax=Enorma phocaeensis TaxID=1871019 RepID=UPI00235489D5|nr:helix-turn-helix transcriptional regulator [Enorma phocaeensis]